MQKLQKIAQAFGMFILDTIEVFAVAAAIFAILYLFIVQPHNVDGSSMEPNFHNGQYMLTNKYIYRFNPYQRGDVIIFKYPEKPTDDFIKRIIGLPEESFKIEDGHITIFNEKNPQGIVLEEDYLKDDEITNGGRAFPEGVKIKIPEEKLLVMGDNRQHSSDSREWGFVPFNLVVGKAWFCYYPLNTFGLIEQFQYRQNL